MNTVLFLPANGNTITNADINKATLRITVNAKRYFDRNLKTMLVHILDQKFHCTYTRREGRSDNLSIGQEAMQLLSIKQGSSIKIIRLDNYNYRIEKHYCSSQDLKNYTINEHIHRFAIWTVSRATFNSWLTTEQIQILFQAINLKSKIEELKRKEIADDYYRNWIKATGQQLKQQIIKLKFNKRHIHFGLAAKMISIYIKTAEVLPTKGESILSAVAYPPLDGFLLKNVKQCHPNSLKTAWSTFDWAEYINWIEFLKEIKKDEPWWKLEAGSLLV